jgi:hypothetical protein
MSAWRQPAPISLVGTDEAADALLVGLRARDLPDERIIERLRHRWALHRLLARSALPTPGQPRSGHPSRSCADGMKSRLHELELGERWPIRMNGSVVRVSRTDRGLDSPKPLIHVVASRSASDVQGRSGNSVRIPVASNVKLYRSMVRAARA